MKFVVQVPVACRTENGGNPPCSPPCSFFISRRACNSVAAWPDSTELQFTHHSQEEVNFTSTVLERSFAEHRERSPHSAFSATAGHDYLFLRHVTSFIFPVVTRSAGGRRSQHQRRGHHYHYHHHLPATPSSHQQQHRQPTICCFRMKYCCRWII